MKGHPAVRAVFCLLNLLNEQSFVQISQYTYLNQRSLLLNRSQGRKIELVSLFKARFQFVK